MAELHESLADLEAKVARSESRTLLRTIALVSLPVVVAMFWLWTTVRAVGNAQLQLVNVESKLADVRDEVDRARKDLSEAQESEAEAKMSAEHANVARAEAEQAHEKAEREREQAVFALAQAASDLQSARDAKEKMAAEVQVYRKQAADLRDELKEMQSRFDELQAQLREAAKFNDHRYELNWAEVKTIAALQRGAAELFVRISELQQRNIGWDMSNAPDRGFNSPGFAEFVLRRPLSTLKRTDNPRPGDIIVYDSGYTMFFFEDRNATRFVVGMTPIGIVALKQDFGAKRLYALRNQ